MSCFARLHVRNPQFEEVRVDLRVRFRDGVDETFHVNKLKREITEFLSPWAFRSDARPTFNGKVYKSVLVNFVEERTYVDYVSDVHLFHRLPGVTADGPDLRRWPARGRSRSSCLCRPKQHGVHPIHPDEVVVLEPALRAGGRLMAPVPAPVTSAELPAAQDFYRLRREGIGHIEQTGSAEWTDYNTHDPGISILEALAYAITELAYRTGFPIEDILASAATGASADDPYPDQTFYSARKILTVNPTTAEDFRRLLIDVDPVRNAWVRCKACACDAPSSPGARTTSWCSPTTRRTAATRPPRSCGSSRGACTTCSSSWRPTRPSATSTTARSSVDVR